MAVCGRGTRLYGRVRGTWHGHVRPMAAWAACGCLGLLSGKFFGNFPQRLRRGLQPGSLRATAVLTDGWRSVTRNLQPDGVRAGWRAAPGPTAPLRRRRAMAAREGFARPMAGRLRLRRSYGCARLMAARRWWPVGQLPAGAIGLRGRRSCADGTLGDAQSSGCKHRRLAGRGPNQPGAPAPAYGCVHTAYGRVRGSASG